MRSPLLLAVLLAVCGGCATESLRQGAAVSAEVLEGLAATIEEPRERAWAEATAPVARAVADRVGPPASPFPVDRGDVKLSDPPSSSLAALARSISAETALLRRLGERGRGMLSWAAAQGGMIGGLAGLAAWLFRRKRRLERLFTVTARVVAEKAPKVVPDLKDAHGDLRDLARPLVQKAKRKEL